MLKCLCMATKKQLSTVEKGGTWEKPRRLWWCEVNSGIIGGSNSTKWLDWTVADAWRMTLAAINTYEDRACNQCPKITKTAQTMATIKCWGQDYQLISIKGNVQ